jgi:hypothetical protein
MDIQGIPLTGEQAAEVQATAKDLTGEGIDQADDLAETLFILSHQILRNRWADLTE